MITHGCLAMMTLTPSLSFASLRTAKRWVKSYGSTASTNLTPQARAISSKETFGDSTPQAVIPVFGFGWWPVIAVILLSKMMTVWFALL